MVTFPLYCDFWSMEDPRGRIATFRDGHILVAKNWMFKICKTARETMFILYQRKKKLIIAIINAWQVPYF